MAKFYKQTKNYQILNLMCSRLILLTKEFIIPNFRFWFKLIIDG